MVVNKLKSTRNKQTGFAQMGYIFFQANFTQNTVAKGYINGDKVVYNLTAFSFKTKAFGSGKFRRKYQRYCTNQLLFDKNYQFKILILTNKFSQLNTFKAAL